MDQTSVLALFLPDHKICKIKTHNKFPLYGISCFLTNTFLHIIVIFACDFTVFPYM